MDELSELAALDRSGIDVLLFLRLESKYPDEAQSRFLRELAREELRLVIAEQRDDPGCDLGRLRLEVLHQAQDLGAAVTAINEVTIQDKKSFGRLPLTVLGDELSAAKQVL